eukprot:TRINITY_DN1929_c0_g2_i3.p1 TRINITY_DN1929_c0_g2~~TRINITY_DN1929_c0_g2_i3.p1  ORF type:complete len:232 (+),score=88.61 TRINITY_DN1929_c0_g2_i3:50-697(+)
MPGAPSWKFAFGSSSKWRRAVLARLMPELAVDACYAPDIDEKAVRHPEPERCCELIARAKAEALAAVVLERSKADGEEWVLLTADQVIKFDGKVREKPESEEENYRFLKGYSETAPLETCSALCLTHFPSGRSVAAVHVVQLPLRPLPDDVIRRVIAKGASMTTAGGIVIEDPEIQPFIVGGPLEADTQASIEGLPIGTLKQLMADLAGRAAGGL